MSSLAPIDRPPPPAPPSAPLPPEANAAAAPALDYAPVGLADAHPLRDYLNVVRRHLWLVLGVAALVAGLGAYRLLRVPPSYQSSATVRLTDVRRALTGNLGMDAPTQLSRFTDPLLSEVQVLRSRELAAAIVARSGIRLQPAAGDELPEGVLDGVSVPAAVRFDTLNVAFTARGFSVSSRRGTATAAYGQPVEVGGVRFTIRSRPPVGQADLVVIPEQDAIDQVLSGLKAVPREDTDVVDIQYTALDPALAQRVANAAALEFQAMNARSAQRESHRRRAFLEEQLHATDSVLMASQSALSAFRSRQGLYSSREQYAAEQTGLMALQGRRDDLVANRNLYQGLLQRLERGAGGDSELRALVSAPGIAANPVVTTLYQQLASYQARRDSLTAGAWGSAPTDPDVQRLDQLIAGARTRLVSTVAEQVNVLDAQVRALDQQRARGTGQLAALPGSETEEVKLVEQVEGTRTLANQLREQYQKARLDEAVEMGQVVILDPATPGVPLGSGRAPKLLFLLIVGLTLGSGAAHLVERMNTRVVAREELEPLLRAPVLALIPPVDRANGTARVGLRRRLHLPPRAQGKSALPALNGPDTVSAEAYRMLRTSLLFSQLGPQLHTIAITSASASEGKSTTSANLAAAFAQHGVRVLLVDCDLRRAQQHQIFGVERTPGVSDLVVGYAGAAQAVRATAVENLFLLPAGTESPNASELGSSPRMRALLADLGAGYDVVILDTPPVMATAEAAVLAAAADGVVMVVRAGHTQRRAAQEVVQHMRSLGVRVLGAVLNDPDGKAAHHDGYYGYHYYGYHRHA